MIDNKNLFFPSTQQAENLREHVKLSAIPAIKDIFIEAINNAHKLIHLNEDDRMPAFKHSIATKFGTVYERAFETVLDYFHISYRNNIIDPKGLDFVLETNDCIKLCQLKTGINWGNANSLAGQIGFFREAKLFYEANSSKPVECNLIICRSDPSLVHKERIRPDYVEYDLGYFLCKMTGDSSIIDMYRWIVQMQNDIREYHDHDIKRSLNIDNSVR